MNRPQIDNLIVVCLIVHSWTVGFDFNRGRYLFGALGLVVFVPALAVLWSRCIK